MRYREIRAEPAMQSSAAARQRADSGYTVNPSSPGSPTLTNPDMILPDYDDGTTSFDRSESPLMMWKNAHVSDMGFNLSPEAFTAGPITPTTPIIYGNGTMLSDIGEVTEVESTCGPSRSRSGSTRSEIALATSTALPYEAIKQKIKQSRMAHQRQMSVGSNSTVTAHDQPGLFVDFDDAVSIDDSNFQGDDEDSVADSYIDEGSAQETISPLGKSLLNADEARYSTPWGQRAEQILANAKRRLTTMEGNLNRARSSLESPPLSSFGSYATPSPPVGRPAIALNPGDDHGRRKMPLGHNRISSDGNIPTENNPISSTQRSLSALGTAGGYRRSPQGSRTADDAHSDVNSAPFKRLSHTSSPLSNSKSSFYGQDPPLEPLSEDGSFGEGDAQGQGNEDGEEDNYLNPFGSFSDKGIKRSSSSAQMRDLKDQVNDLKGRLSSLRDQARADSLKRRSLQSLRTPSPFTHARVDQWYAETSGHEDGATVHDDSNAQTTNASGNGAHDRTSSPAGAQSETVDHDESQSIRLFPTADADDIAAVGPTAMQPEPSAIAVGVETNGAEADSVSIDEAEDTNDTITEDGYESAEGQDFLDSASESDASFYHDSVQAQVSHEDREDAFDYEHFFLHSAMGSMTRKRMRRKGSNDSFSSEDSVETTRGPIVSQPAGIVVVNVGQRSRRGSAESTSTMESFATATEGRHTRVGIITPGGNTDEYSEEYSDEYAERVSNLPERARTHTPDTAKRTVFSPEASGSDSDPRRSQSALYRRPQSSAAAFRHRSTFSTLSTGTNRSFPLIARPNSNRGVMTPEDSPGLGLKQISETLMKDALRDDGNTASLQMLQRDDQVLVQRLVACLGRCILGLSEAGRASAEGRAYRRKIEAARRALESFE